MSPAPKIRLHGFRSRRFRLEWAILTVAVVSLGAMIGITLHERLTTLEAGERERLLTQARVIDDNLGRQLAGVDRALLGLRDELVGGDRERALASLPVRLKALGEAMPGVRTLLFIGAEGRVLASTREQLLGRDSNDRDYFVVPQRGQDPATLYVTAPFRTMLGVFALNVSRVVSDENGRFAGVVSATLDPEYFAGLLGSVLYAPDMKAVLVHADGKIILSVPADAEGEGRNLDQAGSFFARHRDRGGAVSVFADDLAGGGPPRLVAVRTIRPPALPIDKAFVIAVSRDQAAITAGWRQAAVIEIGVFVVTTVLAVLVLAFLQRRQRAFDRLAAEHAAVQRQNAERLRLATQAARVGVWEYDPVADRAVWDASMFALYGVAPDGFSGNLSSWSACVLPADIEAALALVRSAIARGGDFETQFRIRRGDGAIRMLRSLARTEVDADGQTVRLVGVNEDITERWQAEEARRESEARFRLMADAAPVLIWVGGAEAGRSYFNRVWLEFTGCAAETLAGRGWLDAVHPVDRVAAIAAVDRAVAAGQPFALEYRLRRHDGSYRWMIDHGAPRRAASGDLVGYIGSCVDIDDWRHAEQSVRMLTAAIGQSATPVIVTDRDGRIEYVNPACCALYGYAADELIGRNPRLFKSEQTPPQVYADLWGKILAGDTWRGELVNRRKDGQPVVEAVTISPIRDETGRTTHFVAIKEDLSAVRAAERGRHELAERMARLDRMEMLGSMAGGIAHDFNNILVAILGFSGLAETMLRADGRLPRVLGYIEEIHTAGERARALVQQLLTFSRGGPAQLADVRLDAAVPEVIALLRVTLPPEVTLDADLDSGCPLLRIDPSHLHQLLMNLCVNARDALAGRGEIVVSTRRVRLASTRICDSCHEEFSGDFIRIGVRDNGPGIPETIRPRVFEPFFTTKDVGHGTGMGLAVVHGIAHMYGGHLELISAPAQGTEIGIYLPSAAAAGA